MNTFAKIPIGVISQSFGPAAWMRLMEDILGNPISSNMDLIDIAWEGFGALFERIDQREGMVIKMRYADELTLKETGKRIGRKNNPKHLITAEVVRQIQLRAVRKMRHPKCIRIMRSCIAGNWRPYQ